MLTLVSSRSSVAAQQTWEDNGFASANAHRLVCLLLDALQQAIRASQLAMTRGDVVTKCSQIRIALRILDEGLSSSLNLHEGGELADNLNNVYNYCIDKLVHANARNDAAALEEVSLLMERITNGWKQIREPGPAYLRVV